MNFTVDVAIVSVAVVAHFMFIGYLVAGGFLALRWPRTVWLHAAAVVWAAAITLDVVECPLTALERWARADGGMSPLPSAGFIAHYITGELYPESWRAAVRVGVFAVVALSFFLLWRRRSRAHFQVKR